MAALQTIRTMVSNPTEKRAPLRTLRALAVSVGVIVASAQLIYGGETPTTMESYIATLRNNAELAEPKRAEKIKTAQEVVAEIEPLKGKKPWGAVASTNADNGRLRQVLIAPLRSRDYALILAAIRSLAADDMARQAIYGVILQEGQYGAADLPFLVEVYADSCALKVGPTDYPPRLRNWYTPEIFRIKLGRIIANVLRPARKSDYSMDDTKEITNNPLQWLESRLKEVSLTDKTDLAQSAAESLRRLTAAKE